MKKDKDVLLFSRITCCSIVMSMKTGTLIVTGTGRLDRTKQLIREEENFLEKKKKKLFNMVKNLRTSTGIFGITAIRCILDSRETPDSME